MNAVTPERGSSPDDIQVRSARYEDVEAMRHIYNETIDVSDNNFDTQPKSEADMRWWFEAHNERRPVLVAVHGDDVFGWVSLSDWSALGAYRNTAEISMFVARRAQGIGVGTRLLRAILGEAGAAGVHVIVARMTSTNDVSINLHRKHGFEEIGTMREVGNKNGRLLDVYLMQYIVPNDAN